jgi:hypothetical protein
MTDQKPKLSSKLARSALASPRRRPYYCLAIGFDLPRKTHRVVDAYSQACSYRLARFMRAAAEEPNVNAVRGSDCRTDNEFAELGRDDESHREKCRDPDDQKGGQQIRSSQ